MPKRYRTVVKLIFDWALIIALGLLVIFPLGIWKIVDLIVWCAHHLRR